MKRNLATLSAAILLFGGSGALPQNSDSSRSAGYSSAVYAELAKAPGKARDRRNPLENDPKPLLRGGIFSNNIARSATARQRRVEGKLLLFALPKCRKLHPARFSGF